MEVNLRLPVIAAPMFLISGPDLVIECCKNGIIGTLPALNQRTSQDFEKWIIRIKEELSREKDPAPFGVNLIVHPSNPRVKEDLEVCIKHRVPLIITSLGAVGELVDAVHGYGGQVFHDVTNRRHAEKAVQAGVDGIVAVCAGAGGHAGTANPMALVSEIRKVFDKTIVLSGCISTGQDVAAALQMGADLAYMGTRFINTTESMAPSDYKQMIMDCGVSDIVHTPAVSGIPASFMRPSLEKAGYDMEAITRPATINLGEKQKPADEEAGVWKTVWSAGQGCTAVNDVIPVAQLVNRLRDEFLRSVKEHARKAEQYS